MYGNNLLKLSGKSIFKGRNGYALLDHVLLYFFHPHTGETPETDQRFCIDLYSKRQGHSAPACMNLTVPDAEKLIEFLNSALADARKTLRQEAKRTA